MTSRPGTTLLELLVVIAVLGVATAMVGMSINAAPPEPPSPRARIAEARRRAIDEGRAVTLALRDSTGIHLLRAAPDGSVRGAKPFGVERLSGRPADARP